MKNLRHKTRILCLLITILIINLGCAHHLPPLSKEVRANLGTEHLTQPIQEINPVVVIFKYISSLGPLTIM